MDSDKPQDNDFTPFLNIMNEWYAKDTSNKIKSIFLSRMSDGKRCSGSIPYGYNRLPEDKQTLQSRYGENIRMCRISTGGRLSCYWK